MRHLCLFFNHMGLNVRDSLPRKQSSPANSTFCFKTEPGEVHFSHSNRGLKEASGLSVSGYVFSLPPCLSPVHPSILLCSSVTDLPHLLTVHLSICLPRVSLPIPSVFCFHQGLVDSSLPNSFQLWLELDFFQHGRNCGGHH